jgi:hypothetical protein
MLECIEVVVDLLPQSTRFFTEGKLARQAKPAMMHGNSFVSFSLSY